MPIQTRRGVRLTYLKEPAASRELSVLEAKGSLYLPLAYAEQGGTPAASLKTVIRKNQPLVIPDDPASIPVYASVTGTLEGVCTLSHPLYGQLDCAVIAAAPEGDPPPEGKPADLERLSPNDVIEAARQAGIIDELDGVPLHLKLTQWKKEGCGCLVADGVEPEPYASSAWTVLSRSAEQVGQGLALAARCVGAAAYHVAVCLPGDRRRSLQQRLGEDRLFQVRRRYPVDRYAPSSLLRPGPVLRRIGVQALLALYRATAFGEPQTDCVITVAGDAVATPQNLAVPFGVPIREVLAYCGLREDPHYLILGDLMTGRTAPSDELPVLPGMTCLLALKTRPAPLPQGGCIGCGRCVHACHAGLLPYEIVRRLENMHYERLASLHPEGCDGCGACSYVCPAGRDVAVRVQEAAGTNGTIFFEWGDDDDA